MNDRFMKDFSGTKVFSLEYDKETLKDMVLEKQEEIERLNNIIKEDVIHLINEVCNKRIGIGQTDNDKWWLKELWRVEHNILEILDKVKEKENE